MHDFRKCLGTSLVFGYSIYNAALNKSTRLPKLKTRTLVFRDGIKIYASEPSMVEAVGQADLQRIPQALAYSLDQHSHRASMRFRSWLKIS